MSDKAKKPGVPPIMGDWDLDIVDNNTSNEEESED